MFACPPKKNSFPTPPAGLEGFVGQMRSIIPPVGFRVYARIVSMLDVQGNMWKRAARRHSDQMGPATLKRAVFNSKHSFSSFQQRLPIFEKKKKKRAVQILPQEGERCGVKHTWSTKSSLAVSMSFFFKDFYPQSPTVKRQKRKGVLDNFKSQPLSEKSTVNIELLLQYNYNKSYCDCLLKCLCTICSCLSNYICHKQRRHNHISVSQMGCTVEALFCHFCSAHKLPFQIGEGCCCCWW